MDFNYYYLDNEYKIVKEEEKCYQFINFMLKNTTEIILKKIGKFFYNHSS